MRRVWECKHLVIGASGRKEGRRKSVIYKRITRGREGTHHQRQGINLGFYF